MAIHKGAEMKYVFVDTETGGLDPAVHGITEIAAVAFDFDPKQPFLERGMYRKDEFQMVIQPNPNMAYTPYALQLQDRTLQYLQEYGTDEARVWAMFRMFLDTHLGGDWQGHIIAQYAQFDYGFLSALANRAGDGKVLPAHKRCEWICTKNMFRVLSGLGIVSATGCGMNDIMRWYGLDFEGKEHMALVDAKAGEQVFRHMVSDFRKYYKED